MHCFFVHHDVVLPSSPQLQTLQSSLNDTLGVHEKSGSLYSCVVTCRRFCATNDGVWKFFFKQPLRVHAANPRKIFLMKFDVGCDLNNDLPVSEQKQELQSSFHVVPGVHWFSGGLRFCNCLSRIKGFPKQNINVQRAMPLSGKVYRQQSSHSIKQLTWAQTWIASIVPAVARFALRVRWLNSSFENRPLFYFLRWTSSLCAEPTNAISCTSATIAVLKELNGDSD